MVGLQRPVEAHRLTCASAASPTPWTRAGRRVSDDVAESSAMTDARARLLRAAVGFALVPPSEPELRLLHRWLDSWRGVGDVVTGDEQAGLLAAPAFGEKGVTGAGCR